MDDDVGSGTKDLHQHPESNDLCLDMCAHPGAETCGVSPGQLGPLLLPTNHGGSCVVGPTWLGQWRH